MFASRVCWVCGEAGVRLRLCGLCDELRLANPARYCSSDCQRQAWARHKRWHQEHARRQSTTDEAQQRQHEQSAAGLQVQTVERFRAETEAEDAGTFVPDPSVLLARAAQRMADKDFKGASKSLKKVIVVACRVSTVKGLERDTWS